MQAKEFHLGDVLSITTDRLVSNRHMDGVYDILNFMTGDNLFTHQLPRASKMVMPHLLKQHPALSNVVVPDEFAGKGHVEQWLAEQVKIYGETIPVEPMTAGEQNHIDPLIELVEMVSRAPGLDAK